MKIVHYETTTQKLLAWYDKDIHTTIPIPNIEVTDVVWQEALNVGANHVNLDGTLNIVDFRTVIEIEEQAKVYFTNEVQKHIDEAMVVFNTTNSVVFESLANIDSASNRVGYSKQAECKAFADWAYIAVWDTMRAWQATLTAIPTEAEFRTKLATVAYNG